MKYNLVCLSALIGLTTRLYADIMYNVTFEDPPHVAGQQLIGVGPPDGPTYVQLFWVTNVTIMNSQAAITEYQPLNSFMHYANTSHLTSGVHNISWNWALLEPDPNVDLQCNVTIRGTGLALIWYNNSLLQIVDYTGELFFRPYEINSNYLFSLIIDLDSLAYSVSLNDDVIFEKKAFPSETSIETVSFFRPYGQASYAVDNFHWEVIPEPGTNVLLSLGGAGLALKRWYEKRKKQKE